MVFELRQHLGEISIQIKPTLLIAIMEPRKRSRVMDRISNKYKPGITGFVNAHTRKRIVGKEKEGLHSLGITLNHYVPQPNKFEGYSSFPRPVSRPYVNKAEFFKMNVLKKPKGLKQDKFLNIKNKSMNRKDENYKSNNVGTTFLTAKRAQSQNNIKGIKY